MCCLTIFVFSCGSRQAISVPGTTNSVPVTSNFDPVGILLTWQQDPTTTMTIDWHTLPEDRYRTRLEFRKEEDGEWAPWTRLKAASHAFPFSNRTVHRVELTGLKPGTLYEFRFGDDSKTYRFRTMPDNTNEPIQFVIGGDVHQDYDRTDQMTKIAGELRPEFVVIGGDIAYANSDPRRVQNWFEFFEIMKNRLVFDGNRLIPMVVGIGNHEVFQSSRLENSGLPHYYGSLHWGLDDGDHVFFDAFFAFPGKPVYNVLDFGSYLTLIALDTDHGGNPVAGRQTNWLRDVLEERKHIPNILPFYHIGAYPTARPHDGALAVDIRQHWSPLFEQYGVTMAFENHDHTYKRTHPIRNEQVSFSNGVVYMGDGAWGARLKEVGRQENWPAHFFNRADAQHHVILVTLQGGHRHFLVVNSDGKYIDAYPETPFITLDEYSEAEIITPVEVLTREIHGIRH